MMTERTVKDEYDRKMLLRFIERHKLPFTIGIEGGRHRTVAQNRLQRQWVREIAEQLGDRTPEEVRGECKLRFGVPIMREANEQFREKYDAILKPLPYANKLALMMEPLDLPVTRIMTTAQKTDYLDQMHRHFSAMGIALTDPGDLLAAADARAAA